MYRATLLVFLLTGTAAAQAVAQPVDDDDRPAVSSHVPKRKPAHPRDRDDDDRPAAAPQVQAQTPITNEGKEDDHAAAAPQAQTQEHDAGEDSDRDDDEKAQPATAIVVTARRLDTARTSIDRGLGATVYDLNNEVIENRPGGETGSLGSILSQTPGVSLSNSGLTIRGSKAVQVRINGAILPEAIPDPEDRLSSRFAQTTRLITGTLPAEFGFAPGGVIAVTTKNGLYQHGGQAELFAGNHSVFEPAFEWGGSADSSSLFSSGSLESGRTRVADVMGPSASDVRHDIGGLAFADHVIDQADRVSLVVGGSSERDRIGQTGLPAGTERAGDSFAVATLQHSTKDFTVQTSLFDGYSANSADFGQAQHERSNSAGTQVDSSLVIGAANTLRAGLLLTRSTSSESGTVPGIEQAHRTSLGVYAGDEWTPVSGLTLNAGVRADWLRSLGSAAAIEPRASIVWQSPRGFSAHAGYARYASAPPLGEEHSRLPNEHDDYFDAGVQQKIGPVTIGVDGYYRSARNLIVERKVPGEAIASAFVFARGRFRGVDLSATFARGPLSAWANLSFSKSQGRTIAGGATLFPNSTLAAADGRWVNLASDRPATASAGVSWRVGKVNLSGDLLAGSGAVRTLDPTNPNAARAPAFVTVGLAAVYHVRLFDQPLDLRADVTNVTNAHYATNYAANLERGWTRFSQGRSILIGFEQGF